MNITGTFIGVSSLGYETGKRYDLKLDKPGNTITRIDGTGKCKYQSITAFLNNWSNVQVDTTIYTNVYLKDIRNIV